MEKEKADDGAGKLWQSADGVMILTAPDEPESPREGFCDMHCELDLKVVAWAESNEYAGRLYQVLEVPTAPLRTTWMSRRCSWVAQKIAPK